MKRKYFCTIQIFDKLYQYICQRMVYNMTKFRQNIVRSIKKHQNKNNCVQLYRIYMVIFNCKKIVPLFVFNYFKYDQISIRVRLPMDGRMAVCNLMKYQIFLVQTVERILIKKKIKVILFIIISLLYFHSFLYRLSS